MNKIRFGLCNVHVWPITESTSSLSYGAAIPVPGSVSLSLSPAGNPEAFYDEEPDFFGESPIRYEGELELALIPESFEIEILQHEKDANGAVFEHSRAVPKRFAMAFEFSGDEKKTRHILYNLKITEKPEIASSTNSENVEVSTEKFSFEARENLDGYVKAKLTEGSNGYETFFIAPYVKA